MEKFEALSGNQLFEVLGGLVKEMGGRQNEADKENSECN
jgi:hypothetical protein